MTALAAPISITDLPYRLEGVKDAIRSEYLQSHGFPWLIAYSGGKDSTLLLQLAWEVIADLPLKQRNRQILVVGNDTLVESPLVIDHLRGSLRQIDLAGIRMGLPISTEITTPCIDQTFWVSVIGRGYIPPTRNFRWCTDRMKISPTNKLIIRLTQEYGGAILLVGTRRAESHNRRRAMNNRGVSARKLNPQGLIEGCQMFAPLADLEDNDVWMTLMQRSPPWGGTHRRLITLYRNAGGGECPLVVTTEQAPSCGSSSPRFGCWTCTVVKKDRSLKGMINSGYGETDKMEALFDFREWLMEIREDENNRSPVRRNGNAEYREDGTLILGPFRLEVRKLILQKLQELESEIGEQLILPAEIDCIHDVWWRDQVKEDARQALHRSLGAVV